MTRWLASSLAVSPLLVAAVLAHADGAADAGSTPTDAGSTAADAGPPSGPPPGGYLPDPTPMVTRRQMVIDLAYREGDVAVRGARALSLGRAVATPRVMGRFAVELYVGPELLDRVRFDFPLLGAGEFSESRRRWDAPPSFERHLASSAAVMIPQSDRTTRVVLVDRASGRTWTLPWPLPEGPDAGSPAPSASR